MAAQYMTKYTCDRCRLDLYLPQEEKAPDWAFDCAIPGQNFPKDLCPLCVKSLGKWYENPPPSFSPLDKP